MKRFSFPSLAGPIFSRQLAAGVVASMPSHEALLVLGQVLLDAHVGIAETHQLNLVAFLSEHGRLLGFTRGCLGLVVSGELVALVVDHYSFGNAYQPSWIVTRLRLLTMLPLASLAQTRALTDSASLTGCPGGTITTLVGVQPSGNNTSGKIVAQAVVTLAVFKRLILLVDQLVERCLHQALREAGYWVHV